MSESLTIKKYTQQTDQALLSHYDQLIKSKKFIDPTSYMNQAKKEVAAVENNAKQILSEKGFARYQQESEALVEKYTRNYQALLKAGNINVSVSAQSDTDPVSQQVSVDPWGLPVYATFNNGKNVGHNVSGYAGTNNTFSMCDMVCTIDIVSNTGKRVISTLGKLQTLSYSIFQNKSPVRVIGNMNALDYVYGQRTIAGSLIFAVFNQHWLMDIYNEVHDKEEMKNWHFIADEIPPFDITISFANEYGFDSRMAIYGVRLVNEGQTMSINDIYIENTYEYVATDIEILDSLHNWHSSDKLGRRYINTAAIAQGQKEGSASGTPQMKGEKDTPPDDSGKEAAKSDINAVFVMPSEEELNGTDKKSMHDKIKKIYSAQCQALSEARDKAKESGDKEQYQTYKDAMSNLAKQYHDVYKKITNYYNKKEKEEKGKS